MATDFVARGKRLKLNRRMKAKQFLKDNPKQLTLVKDTHKCAKLSSSAVSRPSRTFGISACDGEESDFEKRVRGVKR